MLKFFNKTVIVGTCCVIAAPVIAASLGAAGIGMAISISGAALTSASLAAIKQAYSNNKQKRSQ